MSSCSRSVRSFDLGDNDHLSSSSEQLEICDFDSMSETSRVHSYQIPQPGHHALSLARFRQRAHNLAELLFTLLPRSSRHNLRNDSKPMSEVKLHPTAYLDGMRGLAAFAVFLCHLSYGTFDLTHTYKAGKPGVESENLSYLQLPGIRLIYSGPPMVAIFFVISGYVLSYKPLRQMRYREYDGLIMTLTSSVLRRALRLFLPCFASTLIVVCLVQLGAYELTQDFANDMRMVHEYHTPIAPSIWLQMDDWMYQMLNTVNVFDWTLYSGSIDLDRHLWTIPVEFRCSMALFITHMLVARMRSKIRLGALSFLVVWGTYWGRWEMVPFWAGAMFAEADLIKADGEGIICEKRVQEDAKHGGRSLTTLVNTGLFAAGVYLASYPDADGHISPGYIRLTDLIPGRYSEKHRFWPTIGAMMIVWAVGNLRFLRSTIFESHVMQYLGRISFPLYVCHGFIIHTFSYMLMDWVWRTTGAYEDWYRFRLGFAFSAICTVGVTVWISHIFLHVVDVRCVKFAKWLEGQLLLS